MGTDPTRSFSAAAAAPEAVRKTVTVLFCDVVGSTAFGESVDPEAAREAMGRYFDMARSAVEANDGTVAKFQGDGVMAVFGIPEVAEDDAERAIAAGLELQRRFVGIADDVERRFGARIGLRVGINTGEIVIAADDADLVGDALNTAARLEAACAPGRVLVGEDTWRLTRANVKYEVLGEVSVHGKAEPIGTFQVVEEATPEEEAATPFVGRRRELAELDGVFAAAIAERVAKLATVIGAPGVGKTRLAHELGRARATGTQLFRLRCERSGTATFAPIAELLRDVAGIEAGQRGDDALRALEAFIHPTVADRERLVTVLGSFVGVGPVRSTEEAFFGVRRLLEILGADRPLLIVVDDIQWAEPLLLDLLEHLVEWVQDAAVLVVALARPEIREIRPTFAEPARRVAAVVAIEGLDAEATEELAARLLGADHLPPGLAARLPESTHGNPLFVRELVRMLVDDGVVSRTADGWEMSIDPDAVEVPPTIQSLLATRVERMPADERRFVELASVVGSEFPLGAVHELAEGQGPRHFAGTLERLRRKEVIDPTGAYWGDEPVFRFHHVLIRDAAYRRLLKGSRAELHVRVGDWTERTAADLVGEHEATIAFHFERAHEYRTELGILDEDTDEIGGRAATLLATATGRALERDDLPSAGNLARRALSRLDARSPERADLLLLACEASFGAGDIAAGREALAELDEIAHDPRLEAWADCFHGQLILFTAPDELRDAEEAVGSAAARLAELGDHAGVAKARQVRAGALARLGRVGECEAELDRALTAARLANDRRRVTAVLGSAPTAALWGPSSVPRAGGRCLDVIRLLRITTGSPAVEATSVRCQAVLEALRGRFDTARTMLDTARATAEELGLRQGLMETEFYTGIVELLAGDPAAAEPHLRLAHGGLGKLGIGADAGQAAAYLARSLLLQGQLDEAELLAADSAALAGQNPQTRIAARSVEAELLSARGRHDDAVRLAEEAVALASGRDIIVDHANANLALARVRAAAGDVRGADESLAEALRLFERKGARVDVAGIRLAGGRSPDTAVPALADEARPGWDLCMSQLAAVDAGDVDALESLLSPDFSAVDHGESWSDLDRAAWLEVMAATYPAQQRAFLTTVHEVTPSGVLVGVEVADGEGAPLRNEVWISMVRDGLVVRMESFPADRLDAARSRFAELDRARPVDGSLGPVAHPAGAPMQNAATRTSALLSDAARRGEFQVLEDLVHPDATARDRAWLGRGSGGKQDFIDGMRSWSKVWAGTQDHGGPVAVRGDHLAVVTYRLGTVGEWTVERVGVVEVDDEGLLTHIAFYDPADLDAAVDELDRRFGRVDHPAESNDDDQGAHLSPGAAVPQHAGPTNRADRQVRRDVAAIAGGDAAAEVETIAVRGDGLALHQIRSGTVSGPSGASRWLVLSDWHSSGELAELEIFEAGDFQEANLALDLRFGETLPPALWRDSVIRRWAIATQRQQWHELADLLADDYVATSHQLLGPQRVSGDSLVRWFSAMAEQSDQLRIVTPEIHAASPAGMVIWEEFQQLDADGFHVSNGGVSLVTTRDGLLAGTERFDDHQLDLALVRLEDVTGEVGAGDVAYLSESARTLRSVSTRGESSEEALPREPREGQSPSLI